MKPKKNSPARTEWEGPGDRARQFMREYRGLLGGYAEVPDVEKKKKTKTSRKASTARKPPGVSDLSAEMRQLLERYKREHPGPGVQLVAYVTAGGPVAAGSAAGFPDLPSEEALVILALTETIASVNGVEARSQVLLLRRLEKR